MPGVSTALPLVVASIPSLLITIAVVAMATLFFCCWGKSNSVDVESKSGDTPHKAEPSTDSALAKESLETNSGENGSATKSPVDIVVDSSDLGDFSAVNRETEILRSYRKPPPPKNRARQSRAPRALFKSSTENLDIFAEVSEDNLNLSLGQAITDVSDVSDSARHSDTSLLLRPHPTDDRPDSSASKREDVRSSMLADIEQTLAAMHSQEGSDTIENKEESQNTDKNKNNDGSEEEQCVQTTATSVSSQPSLHPTETSALRDTQSDAKASPGGQKSPLLKSKVGPPVSPKPAVRKIIQTSRVDSEENISTEKITDAESEKIGSSKADSVDSEPKPSTKSTAETIASSPAGNAKEGQESNNSLKSPDGDPANQEQKQDKSQPEIIGDTSQLEQPLSSTSTEQTPSQHATQNGNNDSLGETESDKSECIDSPNRPSSSYDNVDEVEEYKESSSETETDQSPNHNDTEEGSSTSPETDKPQHSGDSKPESTEIQDPKTEDGVNKSGAEPQQMGGRQDSVEEPAGKKTSRIPVRAGSKPRSTPPKTDKQEEGSKL